ncbi:MAG: two-component regulator propeller domain-containing protein [Bacteroidota bacterium]
MIVKYYWRIAGLMVALFSGCQNANQDYNNISLKNDATSPPGVFVHKDSVQAPVVIEVPLANTEAAHVIERVAYERNVKKTAKPEILQIADPIVKTPGENGFLMPEKVKAVPTIIKMGLPETITLKNPISRDLNPFSFMAHSKTQGITHDFISSFYEDKNGNMWIGSVGGGLMRFAGNTIDNYNKSMGANINDIMHIEGDKSGNIWMTTLEGLFMFDGLELHHYNTEAGLLQDPLNSLQIDTEGNIWISYRQGGVSMFDGEYFHHFGKEQGLPESQWHTLKAGNNNEMWIGCYGNSLALFKEGSFHVYNIPFANQENPILRLEVDNNNDEIWFSIYEKGVMKYDRTDFHFYDADKDFPCGRINRIMFDSKGRKWFGTWGNGVFVMDNDQCMHFGVEHGLSNNYISGLFEDSRGIIWIGFYNGGMTRYFGDVFQHFSIKQGIDQDIISLAQTGDGSLWLSTSEQGLVNFNGNEFVRYSNHPEDPVSYMEAIFADNDGNIWLSMNDGGISRFDGNRFYHYPIDQLPENFYLNGGVTDKAGNIWLQTFDHGVVKYNGESFTFYDTNSGLNAELIYAITADRKGDIWIGTWGGGVCKITDEGFTYYTTQDGLAGNYLFSAFEDSQGNMWFGTEGNGVSMFNGKRFINFTSRNGLTDNYIFSITQDQSGNVILGSRFGINVLSSEKLREITIESHEGKVLPEADHLYFVSHVYEDGFLGMGCNHGSLLADGTKVWVGANDRLTLFYPENSWYNNSIPEVNINQIELFNETLDWAKLIEERNPVFTHSNGIRAGRVNFDSLSPWNQIPYNLELSHRNNFITFSFSGPSHYSGKLLYSFFLQGVDQNWHRPTADNKAHYGNLSPGSYTFRVRAMNPMGQWGEVNEYSFAILAPWWQTWWAIVLYLVVAVFLLRAFIRLRIKSLVLENKLLDNEVVLAKKSIEIKQNILANVSHEIRTPLTGIIGLSDLLAETPLNPVQKEYITTLRQSGQNLKEIINQILDYSKIESGQINLINVTFSLNELFSHAKKVFNSLKNGKKIVLETHIAPEAGVLIYSDRGRINQILQNLLYNAVKFTREGKITLTASLEDSKKIKENNEEHEELLLKITVADTGVGIAQEAISKLFVPFFQVEDKDTRNTDSTGLGLAISKKLTEILQGDIGVESELGKGTTFWFTFRVRKAKAEIPNDATDNQLLTSSVSPMRILLVEDKKVNQLVIKLILEKMGHKVTIASHGQIALDIFRPGRFDLIFMDIQMPVMDGITATHELRSRYVNLPPIVGLSANAFEGDREKYMSQGMDEYVVKPVSEASLRKVIATVEKQVENK